MARAGFPFLNTHNLANRDPLDFWLEEPSFHKREEYPLRLNPHSTGSGFSEKSTKRRKITGIPPVFDARPSTQDYRIVSAARTGQYARGREIIVPQKKSFWHTFTMGRLIDRLIHNWIIEEIWLVMNKLTLFGLMMGLMLLGIVFFVVGFLTAFQSHTFVGGAPQGAGQMQGAAASSKPGGKVLGGAVGAGMVGLEDKADAKITGSIAKKMNLAPFIQKEIPAPLQPFIHHATNQATIRATGGALRASHEAERGIRRELGFGGGHTSEPYQQLPAGYGASGQYSQAQQAAPQQVMQPQAAVMQAQNPMAMQQAAAMQGAAVQGGYIQEQTLPSHYTDVYASPRAQVATPQARLPQSYMGGYMVGGAQSYQPQPMVTQVPQAVQQQPQQPVIYIPQAQVAQASPAPVYYPAGQVYVPQQGYIAR